MEDWKPVVGFEGYYEVSDKGNIRSCDRHVRCSRGEKHRPWKGKLLKSNPVARGYLALSLSKEGVVKRKYVHRMVAEAFIENPLKKEQVNHKDGVKLNNRVSNLELMTGHENMKHAYDNGYNNPPKKLTEKDVEEIKGMLNRGVYQKDIAVLYNVSKSQISNIKRGVSWNESKR